MSASPTATADRVDPARQDGRYEDGRHEDGGHPDTPTPEGHAHATAAEDHSVELRRVIAVQAAGLNAMAHAFDAAFAQAVERLYATPGRVIVSGMGKSGHIARKIAATLASTGSPASFVHPAEASHGDLGMITRDDAVIALSNSGETAELSDLIAYTRRFDIPLIAMVRRAPSTLADQADIALLVPASEEACPLYLAPTTSTTQMMVLGDALSTALLRRRGFTPDAFQTFHPGGSLGKRLLRVADIMHTGEEVPLITPDRPMSEAILAMTTKRFGCVGISHDGAALLGVITDGDLRRHMDDGLLHRNAGAVMTENPLTIRPGALASEAVGVMNTRKITSLFVAEDDQPVGSEASDQGRVVGILHIHDCLRAGLV